MKKALIMVLGGTLLWLNGATIGALAEEVDELRSKVKFSSKMVNMQTDLLEKYFLKQNKTEEEDSTKGEEE